MGEINEVKRAIRHENWKQMYEEYLNSGMTVKKWCEAQGISVKPFYYRLRVLREELLSEHETREIVAIAACENDLPVGRSTHSDDRIHISGNGVEIELPMSISPELMMAILQGDKIKLKDMKGSYFIVCGYTDLRRGIDGLAGIVQQDYKIDACSGELFLFCERRCDRIKALLWEGYDFLLLYKWLDNGGFQWPRNITETDQITAEQYTWLMQGVAYNSRRQ